MPLMWAHAEYIKLLRSARDGKVFDVIPAVADHYISDRRACRPLEVWKPNRQPASVKRGFTLRVRGRAAFRLHWSGDEWQTANDTSSCPTALGIAYVDIPIPLGQRAPIRFTFFWTGTGRWEGRDYMVRVE